jgi:hypothetical protein
LYKFFDRFVENDLESLFLYLSEKQGEILSGSIGNIPADVLSKYTKENLQKAVDNST